MDSTKTFDPENILYILRKIFLYGIRDIDNDWTRNYLTARVKFSNLGDSCSSVLPIQMGVPWGSILGALIFLIFKKVVCDSSEFLKFCLNANDSSLLYSSYETYASLLSD